MVTKSVVVVLVSWFALSSAFRPYMSKIPNGDKVPNPCGAGTFSGVGHYMSGGGGERNRFGLDFAAANHVWTVALCQADSDNDNISNGEELGDPNCRWTPGSHVHLNAPKSHPGYCDLDTQECRTINMKFHC